MSFHLTTSLMFTLTRLISRTQGLFQSPTHTQIKLNFKLGTCSVTKVTFTKAMEMSA